MATVDINKSRVGKAVGDALEPAVRKRLEIAVERAKNNVPVRTGELRDSIRYEIDHVGPDGVRGRLVADADHAQIIHEGRAAITSQTPMVFVARSGAKVFTHISAAVPANRFLTNAVRSTFGGSYTSR